MYSNGGGYPQVNYGTTAHPYQQQQQQHSHSTTVSIPPAMPPPGGNNKRKAMIVGINYFGTRSKLNGCINDAKCMEYMLLHRFGFKQENILLMTDDHPDPLRRPTRYNMFQGFTWLTMNLRKGDSLVFHYSGHGSQKRDRSGEELDGMCETLCPMDFHQAGEILDYEMNKILINPLPQGVKLHAIIDACHSGSALNLPYSATVKQDGYPRWESQYAHPQIAVTKGTAGGFAVQLGAALDHQTAADTTAMSGNTSTGAATFSFIKAIESRGLNLSYGDLLLEMHRSLGALRGGGGGMGGMGMGMGIGGGMMMGGGLDSLLAGFLGGSTAGYKGQEPMMSANYAFDLNFKFGF
jgi:metacaspase-1